VTAAAGTALTRFIELGRMLVGAAHVPVLCPGPLLRGDGIE
jgi:hypothetical protein